MHMHAKHKSHANTSHTLQDMSVPHTLIQYTYTHTHILTLTNTHSCGAITPYNIKTAGMHSYAVVIQ